MGGRDRRLDRYVARRSIADDGLRDLDLTTEAVGVDVVEEMFTGLSIAIHAVGDAASIKPVPE